MEKVLRKIPRNLQEKISADLEQQQVKVREDDHLKSVNMVMRSRMDFFMITVDDTENVKCQTIEFSHGKKDVLFNLDEESDGTIRLLDLLEILIAGEGKTYVIDELDRCLHPSLTYKFVDTFLQLAEKKNLSVRIVIRKLFGIMG